jgi:hypothetical protein
MADLLDEHVSTSSSSASARFPQRGRSGSWAPTAASGRVLGHRQVWLSGPSFRVAGTTAAASTTTRSARTGRPPIATSDASKPIVDPSARLIVVTTIAKGILEAIRYAALDGDHLAKRLGITRRQSINQTARRLEAQGKLVASLGLTGRSSACSISMVGSQVR